MTMRNVVHKGCTTLCLVIAILGLKSSASAADPTPTPSPSPTASPASTITQSFSELSAQHAAAERSQIYRAGAAYGRWLDQIAKDADSAFLQRLVFDHVTWMRVLACVVALG